MPDSHDNPGVGPGGNFEFRRQGGLGSRKGVIARDGNVLRYTTVYPFRVVLDERRFPMNNLSCIRYVPAECAEYTLSESKLISPRSAQHKTPNLVIILEIEQTKYTYSPIQTPRIGIFPEKCLMQSMLTPESVSG